ncbi:MAG TPA: hypothetical protein VH301_11450 [Usitatibacter sp.]|jgi:hypothetical protein|nr:hypothetical protein [Usitatibacter sp.]
MRPGAGPARRAVAAFVAACLAGCASVGPSTIARDRIDYDQAITTSWKRAMLLNMVKLRYGDTPMFLDVASIINSYTLEGQVSGGANWSPAPGSTVSSLGGFAHYADKPTITYNPLLGERFTRSMMTPMQPGVVVSLIQSGWAADLVMRLMVSSANGVYNRFGGGGRARGADPDFSVITGAMRRIQGSAAVGMRVDKGQGQDLTVLVLHRKNMSPEIQADVKALRSALGIREGAGEIRVFYGSVPKADDELALVTRSMLEILVDLASGIEAPAGDVSRGMVPPARHFDTDEEDRFQPLVQVHSGDSEPKDAFVSVAYHGHWFWIDDTDYASKTMFSFVMMIFSLMDTAAPRGQPIVTIPAG